MWAHADQKHKKHEEEATLATESMSKAEKSELLHQVSASAFSELKDDADPSRVPKTEQQIENERAQQANEVEAQTLDLDKHTFGANDLKDFTALTEQ